MQYRRRLVARPNAARRGVGGPCIVASMAILKIARMGHPVLRQRAAEVHDPTAPEIRQLITDMLETLEDADGAGLAAPQVHVPLRLVMFHVPAHRASGAGDDQPAGL